MSQYSESIRKLARPHHCALSQPQFEVDALLKKLVRLAGFFSPHRYGELWKEVFDLISEARGTAKLVISARSATNAHHAFVAACDGADSDGSFLRLCAPVPVSVVLLDARRGEGRVVSPSPLPNDDDGELLLAPDTIKWMCSVIGLIIGSSPAARVALSTLAMRDAAVEAAACVTTSDAAHSVSSLIIALTKGPDMRLAKQLFATESVRNVLIDIAVHVAAPSAAQQVCRALCSITSGSDIRVKRLFATEAMRDALVKVSRFATSPNSVQWLASAICNLASSRDGSIIALLATPSVRDMLATISGNASTANAAQWWSSAIYNLASGPDHFLKSIFATSAMHDAFVVVGKNATSSLAVRWWADAIALLTSGHNTSIKAIFASKEIRDVLVAHARNGVTTTTTTGTSAADAINGLASAFLLLTSNTTMFFRATFQTDCVRDAFVAILSNFNATSVAATSVCRSITTLTANASSSVIGCFATVEVRDAMILAANNKAVSTPDAVRYFSSAVCNITGSPTTVPSVMERFGSLEMRDAFITMSRCATTPDAVLWLLSAIQNIVGGPSRAVHAAFASSTSVRDMLLELLASTTSTPVSDTTAQRLFTIICKLLHSACESERLIFATEAVRDLLVAVSRSANTNDTVRSFYGAIFTLVSRRMNTTQHSGATYDASLFAHVKMRNAILATSRFVTSVEAALWMYNAIAALTSECPNDPVMPFRGRDLFAISAVFDVVIQKSDLVTTTETIHAFGTVLCQLTNGANAQQAKAYFGTEVMHNVLISLSKRATTCTAARSIARAFVSLTNGADAPTRANLDTPSMHNALNAMRDRFCLLGEDLVEDH